MLMPHIQTKDEILDKAFSRASKKAKKKKVKGKSIDKAIQKERLRINISSSIIVSRLEQIVKKTFSYEDLSPFYREMVDIIVNVDKFKKSLARVDWAYKKVSDIKGDYKRKVNRSSNPNQAKRAREQFYGRVSNILDGIEEELEYLNKCKTDLEKLPSIRDVPTVVLSGFPNVGKTYLLKVLTGSEPQIESYPFTTKNINVGFFKKGFQEYQVLDPPGLLDRPIEDMNRIEKQSVSALKYLANIIVYVFDPSETSYPIKKQLELLKEIKKEFEGIEIIVVINKMDSFQKKKVKEIENNTSIDHKVSAKEKTGIGEFKENVSERLKEVRKFD
ncbi:MAG: NOG1 family protein [Candidatus Aenigmatarchaeota archaeon]